VAGPSYATKNLLLAPGMGAGSHWDPRARGSGPEEKKNKKNNGQGAIALEFRAETPDTRGGQGSGKRQDEPKSFLRFHGQIRRKPTARVWVFMTVWFPAGGPGPRALRGTSGKLSSSRARVSARRSTSRDLDPTQRIELIFSGGEKNWASFPRETTKPIRRRGSTLGFGPWDWGGGGAGAGTHIKTAVGRPTRPACFTDRGAADLRGGCFISQGLTIGGIPGARKVWQGGGLWGDGGKKAFGSPRS